VARREGEGVALTREGPDRARLRRALRRTAVVLSVAAVAVLAAPGAAAGARPSWREDDESRLNAARRLAIRKGCEWLAAQAQPDGAFGMPTTVVATTALATLALMSEGSSTSSARLATDRGPHGKEVRRSVGWLLKAAASARAELGHPDGYFDAPQEANSRIHGHGYATLALACALGTADAELAAQIRRALEKAVRVAEESQTGTGGWGYEPAAATEHEGSVTATIAQGLRAARDAGVLVSAERVRAGLRYLSKIQKKEPRSDEDGSFQYSLTQERSSYALTAAALSSFYLFGEYGKKDDPADPRERAVRYLKRRLPYVLAAPSRASESEGFFFYGNFYAAWAAWQRDGNEPLSTLDGRAQDWGGDDPRGLERTWQLWGPWHANVYPRLIGLQRADGNWNELESDRSRMNFGDVVPTAFAVLTLAIPDEMLPVFQR
jgi:hypothetical protein